MEQQLARYYELKQIQKQVEEELEQLRNEILKLCEGVPQLEAGEYRVHISVQERREYDDNRLYDSLPEPGMWRLVSKADPGKISGLLKLKVINEEMLRGTYDVRNVPVLRVQKK